MAFLLIYHISVPDLLKPKIVQILIFNYDKSFIMKPYETPSRYRSKSFSQNSTLIVTNRYLYFMKLQLKNRWYISSVICVRSFHIKIWSSILIEWTLNNFNPLLFYIDDNLIWTWKYKNEFLWVRGRFWVSTLELLVNYKDAPSHDFRPMKL